ncbi:hypothetical protein, partial [Klebsiella pneumoniae]
YTVFNGILAIRSTQNNRFFPVIPYSIGMESQKSVLMKTKLICVHREVICKTARNHSHLFNFAVE